MKSKRHISFFLGAFLFLGLGCKSAKTISSGDANFNLSAKQLIRENTRQSPKFKTLASRVKIDLFQGNEEQGYTVNLRMEKDKQILLMSTPISVVKALITPDKVRFYNKLDNTYFDGDFKYLSQLLGTELNFQKVQNLLLGEALYNLKDEDYDVSIHEKSYVLQPRARNDFFEIFFLLNPSHFKINSQQLAQPQKARMLQIDYLAYQAVDKQSLPEHIKVIALDNQDETILDLEFKAVTLNGDLRFPFKIPSGYNEIILE